MVFIKDGTDTSRQLPERAVYKGITESLTSRHISRLTSRHISRLTSRQTSRYYMLNLSPHRVGVLLDRVGGLGLSGGGSLTAACLCTHGWGGAN